MIHLRRETETGFTTNLKPVLTNGSCLYEAAYTPLQEHDSSDEVEECESQTTEKQKMTEMMMGVNGSFVTKTLSKASSQSETWRHGIG